MTLSVDTALTALRKVEDPDLKRDLVSLGMIRDLSVSGDSVSLRVVLTTPACPMKAKIQADVENALKSVGANRINVTMDAEVRRASGPSGHSPQPQGGPPRITQDQRMPGVKAVIAVAAGKGGVGKSTVATNLAIALKKLGAKVGILDADIYGPSLPIMLGLQGARPAMTAEEKIAPVQRYGLSVMSMGFMLTEDQAVVWRGPMLGKALQQFIEDVDWGELDYVIVDMPPGTGDVQLSLAQLLPVAGCVVVTTPQDVAFADVRRAIKQLEMTKTEVLGVVENMAGFTCGQCGSHHAIFGESRIGSHCDSMGLELIGQIALDSVTAIAADQGEPITLAAPDSAAAKTYEAIARRVAQKVSIIAHDREETTSKFSSFFSQKPSA
jgi:ATP-binding protein involved in chromosome partitioning